MNKASHSDIAQRAYAIWEREGRPHGRDFEHWLKAEREMASPALPGFGAQAGAARTLPAAARRTPTRAKRTKKTSS